MWPSRISHYPSSQFVGEEAVTAATYAAATSEGGSSTSFLVVKHPSVVARPQYRLWRARNGTAEKHIPYIFWIEVRQCRSSRAMATTQKHLRSDSKTRRTNPAASRQPTLV